MHMVLATFDLFHRNNQGIFRNSIVRCIDMKMNICIICLKMTIHSYKNVTKLEFISMYLYTFRLVYLDMYFMSFLLSIVSLEMRTCKHLSQQFCWLNGEFMTFFVTRLIAKKNGTKFLQELSIDFRSSHKNNEQWYQIL